MNVPVEELQHAIDVLKHLDPKPGRRYDSSRTIYVEPDVQVVKVDDDYVVLFNDDGLPRLKVSPVLPAPPRSRATAPSTAKVGATCARRCGRPSGS